MESVSIPSRIVLAALCFGVQRRLVSCLLEGLDYLFV